MTPALKPAVIAASTMLFLAACGAESGSYATAATARATATATSPAAGPTLPPAPPPPAEASQHLAPSATALNRTRPAGAPPYRCDAPRGQAPGMSSSVDLSPKAPTTLQAMARSAVAVALVKVGGGQGAQYAYWHRPAPGEPMTPSGLVPQTTTNFQVEQVAKGSAGTWMQVVQEGAKPGALSACDTLGYVVQGDPLPNQGQEYVVFAQAALGGDRYQLLYGAYEEFPVINGIVWPPAYLNKGAMSLPNFTAEPLAQFLRDAGS
jgi:hypothetical protein